MYSRTHVTAFRRALVAGSIVVAIVLLSRRARGSGAQAPDPCAPPNGNPVVCENQQAGAPGERVGHQRRRRRHDQGFATDISVNRGETVDFKIDTTASELPARYLSDGVLRRLRRPEGGDGHALGDPAAGAAGVPERRGDRPGRLRQLGESRRPGPCRPTAVSGIYFAKLDAHRHRRRQPHRLRRARRQRPRGPALPDLRHDVAGLQPVRRQQPLRRRPGPTGRAYKVSYNRPVHRRAAHAPRTGVFNAEYPMVRWLEANGYDVSYFTGIDTDRLGAELLEHKVFLSVGHDEYWSGAQRANVEAARDAGVHLAFFSGNEVFWKTRWETEHLDGSARRTARWSATRRRTPNAKIDPTAHGVDRHVAGSALQPAGRWRPSGECTDRHDLHGQLRHAAHRQCRRPTASCDSGATPASPTLAPGTTRDADRRHARIRMGRGRSTTRSGPRG